MSQYIFKMPDLGEGTVDAEIVAWHTKPGDQVTEDQLIVEVMTDKAAVEVPAPVSGTVVSVSGAPGEKVAVGSPLIVFELNDGARAAWVQRFYGRDVTGRLRAAGFAEIDHYYRPPGLPREEQPWLASVWRKTPLVHDAGALRGGS